MKQFFTKNKQQKQDFLDFLTQKRRIVITTHQNPDGDAFGSSLGLARYLKKKGHQVQVISPTDYADFLAWMPDCENVLIFNQHDGSKTRSAKLVSEAELIFCLDFSALQRIGDLGELVKNAIAPKVLIDHHEKPENFAKYVFWNVKAASTTQLVYQFIKDLGDKNLIDIPLAECLYTGLMTDTGSFRFDATTPEVHKIAAELLKIGVRPNPLYRRLFDVNTPERLRLLGYALSQKMVVLPEYRVAYMTLTAEELKRFGSKMGDTEGMVNFALSINNTVMAVLFTDRNDHIRMSFRSVEDFSVAELARQHFEGGGHKNAAGGRSSQSLDETVAKFLSLLPSYQERLLETNV